MYAAIVAFCHDFGIGSKNKLPWNIPEDLAYFQNITQNAIVIMGRETYFSIPPNRRPLKHRINVIVTSTPERYADSDHDAFFLTEEQVLPFLASHLSIPAFFIGGERIYRKFLPICEMLYVTYIDRAYPCDRYFPQDLFMQFKLHTTSDVQTSNKEQCKFRFLSYKKRYT